MMRLFTGRRQKIQGEEPGEHSARRIRQVPLFDERLARKVLCEANWLEDEDSRGIKQKVRSAYYYNNEEIREASRFAGTGYCDREMLRFIAKARFRGLGSSGLDERYTSWGVGGGILSAIGGITYCSVSLGVNPIAFAVGAIAGGIGGFVAGLALRYAANCIIIAANAMKAAANAAVDIAKYHAGRKERMEFKPEMRELKYRISSERMQELEGETGHLPAYRKKMSINPRKLLTQAAGFAGAGAALYAFDAFLVGQDLVYESVKMIIISMQKNSLLGMALGAGFAVISATIDAAVATIGYVIGKTPFE